MKSPLITTAALAALSFTAFATPATANDPVWDANKVELTSHEMGSGTIALIPSDAEEKAPKGAPIATTSGFVIGDNAVLVIDTSLNERLMRQIEASIAKRTDLPITYAVNTSYHGDHSYGNHFLPEKTLVIQHAFTDAYIEKNFKTDTQFMMSIMGKGRGIEEVKPTPADIMVQKGGAVTLDLGGKTVEIRDFGFAQTGGDLFVWVPEDRVMWVGNAVVAGKPTLPWQLDGGIKATRETLQAVYDFLPEDAKIVPGHGPVIGREDLMFPITYLTELEDAVRSAVDKGLTAETAGEAVALAQYSNYALYGWVHNQLNVSKAFAEFGTKASN